MSLTVSDVVNLVNANNSSSSSESTTETHPSVPSTPEQKRAMKISSTVIHLGLGFMVAANGALAVGGANSVNDAGAAYIGLYMIMFAIILFVHEVEQLVPNDKIDEFYKKNFGFLYGTYGKACYVLLYVFILLILLYFLII